MENQISQPATAETLLETPPETAQPDVIVPETAYADPGTALVISRAAFYAVVSGIVFFVLGLVVGGAGVSAVFNANSVENRQIIDLALGDNRAVMEETLKNAIGSGGTAQGLRPGERYEVVSDETHPTRGPADAPVEIIEFSDFRCPYCGRFFNETLQPLLTNYDGKIRLVFRDYPILGAASVLGALGGKCANDQDAFWAFHDLAFSDQNNLTREAFVQYAEEMNLDVERFTACLDNQEHLATIQTDYSYAQNLGVTGTPAFFINGRFVSGAQPYAVFAAIIDEELGQSEESTPEPVASS